MSAGGLSPWPDWRVDHPEDLARFVAPTTVRSLVTHRADGQPGGLPGPDDSAAPADLARTVYDTLARVGIRYADEQLSDGLTQRISTPLDVLHQPRRGNCLDLALVFAAACLDAHLHPTVVVVTRPRAAHALVLVDCRADDPDTDEADAGSAVVRPSPGARRPDVFAHQIRTHADDLGRYLPVDAAALAAKEPGTAAAPDHPNQTETTSPASFDQAVTSAAEILTGDDWSWEVSVDIAALWSPREAHLKVEARALPLTAPFSGSSRYHDAPTGSALHLMDPRTDIVQFAQRPEYRNIMDYVRDPTPRDGVQVVVVHGDGGTGKTRLAAQIAHDLADEGWLTGFVSWNSQPRQREWLAQTTSPMFVVLDYPEAIVRPKKGRPLLTVLADRPPSTRTFVMLTSRRPAGDDLQWWDALKESLGQFGLPKKVELPPAATHPSLLYRRALTGFAKATGRENQLDDIPQYDPSGLSPLEIMLLAWVALGPDAPAQQPTTTDLAEVLRWLVRRDDVLRLVHQWIATPSWSDSAEFMEHHRDDLLADDVGAVLAELASSDGQMRPVALQHFSLWRLARGSSNLDEVVELARNPYAARDEALDGLYHGDVERFGLVTSACPQVYAIPTVATASLTVALVTAASDEERQAVRRQLTELVRALTQNDRDLVASTLRGWRRALDDRRTDPDQAARLDDAVALLADPVRQPDDVTPAASPD